MVSVCDVWFLYVMCRHRHLFSLSLLLYVSVSVKDDVSLVSSTLLVCLSLIWCVSLSSGVCLSLLVYRPPIVCVSLYGATYFLSLSLSLCPTTLYLSLRSFLESKVPYGCGKDKVETR